MARIRTIKPEFFKHERLFDAERETALPLRLAFAGLWTQADKAGRFEWRPRQLKTDILPYDDTDFARVLDALATRGFIVRYRVDDREFGAIPSWDRHQVVNNRERESEIPPPNENNTLTRAPRDDDACPTPLGNCKAEGKGKEGEWKGRGEEAHEAVRAEVLPPESKPDPRKAIFDDGLRWLSASTNKPSDKLRPLMARWIKARGDPEVAAAIIAAQQAGPVEPISWIEARLKSNERARPSDLQRRRSLAEAFLSVGTGGDGENPPPPSETLDGLPHGTG